MLSSSNDSVEQVLDDALLALRSLQRREGWEAYAASRPGRSHAVSTLLLAVKELQGTARSSGRPAPRSTAMSSLRMARRHTTSFLEHSPVGRPHGGWGGER